MEKAGINGLRIQRQGSRSDRFFSFEQLSYFLSFVSLSSFVKKIFSILSAFIFLFGAAGYYLAFTSLDCAVKNEIAQSVRASHHQTVHFSFSRKELQNEVRFTSSDQNEFIYNGENYDVVKTMEDADRISFICIADKKETALFAHFDNKLNEQSSSNTSGNTPVKSVMQDWFFQNYFSEIFKETFKFTSANIVLFLSNIPLEFPSPPPKC